MFFTSRKCYCELLPTRRTCPGVRRFSPASGIRIRFQTALKPQSPGRSSQPRIVSPRRNQERRFLSRFRFPFPPGREPFPASASMPSAPGIFFRAAYRPEHPALCFGRAFPSARRTALAQKIHRRRRAVCYKGRSAYYAIRLGRILKIKRWHGAVGTASTDATRRVRACAADRGGIGKGVNEKFIFAKRTHVQNRKPVSIR